MLSTHYPLAFATQYNWVIAALVFLIGLVIRHYFNTRHAKKGNPHWTWLAAAVLFICIIWLSTNPKLAGPDGGELVPQSAERFMNSPHFEAVTIAVQGRCTMCHTAEPLYEGIAEAPKNVVFDTETAIALNARAIAVQAGYTHAMPPGNVSFMTEDERALIVIWYRESTAGGWPL
jgi:uncharacterized membrane protein